MSENKEFSILSLNIRANTSSDLEPHLTRLREMDDVEVVRLGGNSLGVEACEELAKVLQDKKSLKIADFADIFTGRLISEIPQSLSALCDALASHPSLVELDLSDNAFGGRCADAMVPFLKTNRSMEVFKLNNNGLGVWGGTVVAGALLERAKEIKKEGGESKLKVVVCGRNRLENGSAPHWAEAFEEHGGLEEVRLPQNGIRMEGIAALAKGLRGCPKLRHLDLQDNTATESGTRAISASIPSWPELRVLNLSDCLLGPKGGISLATALAAGNNKKLQTLKLQYGEFDARAIHTLAKAIEEHLTELEVLELNGNRADPEDECIERVKDALEKHGHADALDELDDMEDPEEEDEDENDDQSAEEESEDEEVAAANESEPKNDVSVLRDLKTGESIALDREADELADRLGSVSVKEA